MLVYRKKELIQEFQNVVLDYEIKVDDLVEPVIHAPSPLPIALCDDVKKT